MAVSNIVNDTLAARNDMEAICKELWAVKGDIIKALDYVTSRGIVFTGTGFTGQADDPEASNMVFALDEVRKVLVAQTTNIAKGQRKGG